MDNQYYPFDIKSKRLLMKIDVNTSLRLGYTFFEIHEMEDSTIKAYCRKGLPKLVFIEYSAIVDQSLRLQTDLNNHQEWYILRRRLCSKDRMLTNLPYV